ARVGIKRASMQATTATFFAGGSGRSPLSKLSAYLLLFSMSSSVVLIGASVQKIGSLVLDAGERSCEDEPLDLRCALEDRVDLRVAVHALDRVLARVAVAAEDLHRALGRPHRALARLELAHRPLGGGELLAAAGHPRPAPDEQAGGVDLELHVGEHERDRLVLDDRLAELLAILGVAQRVLVGR